MDYLIQEHIDNFLYIDIETLPKGEKGEPEYPEKPTEEDVKVGNRKGETAEKYRKERLPSLIKEWEKECKKVDDKIEEEYRNRSLHSEKGRLYCICYAMNDEPVKTIKFLKDEKKMIQYFVEDLFKSYDRTLATVGWVGHNIRNFDLPWIVHRMWKYNVRDIIHYMPQSPRDKRVIDTGDLWGVTNFKGYKSLDDICQFLGLKTKEGIDGSQVYDYYLEGDHKSVYKYCKDDVSARLRPLHNIIRGESV